MKHKILSILLCVLTTAFLGCGSDDTEVLDPGMNQPQDYEGIRYAYPDSASTGQSRSPVFYFHAPDGLSGWDRDYHIAITDEFMGGVLIDTLHDSGADLFRYEFPGTLDAGVSYFWNISVYDSNGFSYSRDDWSFTTGDGFNNPPWKPFDPSPSHMADSIPEGEFMLYWDCIDPDGDALSYDVWIKRNGSMMGWIQYGFKISETEWDPGTFYAGATFNWQIIAFDEHGDSTVGNRWVFVTGE
jgi:hypothetical protein